MKTYYLNKNAQNTGEHEVHSASCRFLPIISNSIYLGIFNTPEEAVRKAKRIFPNVDGCKYCLKECHKK